MTRPAHWYPLAATDPVPGEPGVVSQAAADYAEVADAIQTAADRLRSIANLRQNKSKAVSAVADRADDVAGKIDRAHGRYVAVGRALSAYATSLSRAQDDSLQAYYEAQTAQSQLDSATSHVARASAAVDDAPDTTSDDDLTRLKRALSSARADRDDADAALAAARRKLHAAIDDRDRAAKIAAGEIRDAVKADGLKDSWWKNFTATIAPYCAIISKIAGIIASVAGILALVLCWVPVLGEVLGVIAAIATAVKLLADLGLVADGKGSWGDVGWDVFALATFGAGRVLSTAASSVARGTQAIARMDSGVVGAMSNAERAAANLPVGSAQSTIVQLVGEDLGALSRQAARGQLSSSSSSLLGALGKGETWATLKPSAIVEKFGELDQINFAKGWGNLGAGVKDWRVMVSALQGGDDILMNGATGLGDISSQLVGHAGNTRLALYNTNATFGALAGITATGGVDATAGIRGLYDYVHDGTPVQAAILSPFRDIPSLWAPSPVDRLKLP